MLGSANALVSAYWAVGGTAGLDTVGGGLEELARSREPIFFVGIWIVVAAKIVGAVLGVALLRADGRRLRRILLVLTWLAGGVLTLYGGTYVLGQILVASGVLTAAPDADWTAIYGHLFLWDPWFLIWGLLLIYVAARAPARATPPGQAWPPGVTRPVS